MLTRFAQNPLQRAEAILAVEASEAFSRRGRSDGLNHLPFQSPLGALHGAGWIGAEVVAGTLPTLTFHRLRPQTSRTWSRVLPRQCLRRIGGGFDAYVGQQHDAGDCVV